MQEKPCPQLSKDMHFYHINGTRHEVSTLQKKYKILDFFVFFPAQIKEKS